MELRQLVSLDAVVRYGGFSRAAEHLGTAQPAISAQVRRLEDELGVRLLARTTRRVGLTEAGELFLARVRRVLTELETARDEAADLAGALRGQVVLGAAPVLGGLDLAAALADFAARHPGVLLTVRSGSVAALLADLAVGEVDLVLGPVHDDLPRGHTTTPLLEDALVLLTPPGHRLGRSARIDLADLRDEAFVCLPPDSDLRRALDAAAADAGFRPDVPFEAATPEAVQAFVAAGLGVAVLAASTVRHPGPAVGLHRVRPALHHPPVGLVHRGERHLSPAARALHAHLEQAPEGGGTGGRPDGGTRHHQGP
ncbi:LysR family transcriptional regulator [Actinomycetospora cinnamomea]|uniref:LysR family transcriptional regulator n=1 Tax=Actinomycetospora cinnamomea TaxID=663609 RepID=UPI000E30F65C|nr:LysR family transcriptional regulator [Actinomycetospora cinnamomea]